MIETNETFDSLVNEINNIRTEAKRREAATDSIKILSQLYFGINARTIILDALEMEEMIFRLIEEKQK